MPSTTIGSVRVWLLVLLVLTSGTATAVAQVTEPDVRIEGVAYTGDGNVTVSGDEIHLWRAVPHEFVVTASTDEEFDGDVCLVAVQVGSEHEQTLACESVSLPANATEEVTLELEEWPEEVTGPQQVRAVLNASNASDDVAGDSLSITVIREDGDLDDDGLENRREAVLGTGLRTTDSDGDGLSDGEEVLTHETSPTTNDSDGDGLSDRDELRTHQTDPTEADSDDDGLPDDRELAIGTNPNTKDSDGDGLNDALEVNTHETNPLDADTDGDGIDDAAEVETHETNPSDSDTDDDGLADNLEVGTFGTDPNAVDSDGDGLEDGVEVDEYQTDPADADTDADGLEDGAEVNTHGTNPLNVDTDDDGLEDGAEVNQFGTNPLSADTDNDGRNDRVEVAGGSFLRLQPPVLVAGAVVVGLSIVVAALLLFRSDRDVVGDLRRGVRVAGGELASRPGDSGSLEDGVPDDVSPPADGDRYADEVPLEFLPNEKQVRRLLDDHGGRMRQTDLVEETGWSKSKVSRVLSEMADEGEVVKIDVGGGNVVTRPDDLPPGARSPFDDRSSG